MRWDFNTPVFENQDRINYGFDTQTINPVSARINQQQFAGYQVRGGLGFVDVNGNPKYPYQWDRNNIQPRVGFAYLLGDKTVVRGGYGLYYVNVVGISASNGFGIQTPLITSLDGDRTSTFPLASPFAQGISQPPGSSQGLATFLGRSVGFSNLDFVSTNPRSRCATAAIRPKAAASPSATSCCRIRFSRCRDSRARPVSPARRSRATN